MLKREELYTANITLLRKHYDSQTSFFGRTAAFYGSIPIWFKILAALAFIAIIITLCVLIPNIIVWCVCASVTAIALGVCLVFFEHNYSENKRFQLMTAKVQEAQNRLDGLTKELKIAEESLQKELATLSEENGLHLEQIAELKKIIITLNEESEQLKQSIDEIESVKLQYADSTGRVVNTASLLAEEIDGYCKTFSSQAHTNQSHVKQIIGDVHRIRTEVLNMASEIPEMTHRLSPRLQSDNSLKEDEEFIVASRQLLASFQQDVDKTKHEDVKEFVSTSQRDNHTPLSTITLAF